MSEARVVLHPPAKLNLTLDVLFKRDGLKRKPTNIQPDSAFSNRQCRQPFIVEFRCLLPGKHDLKQR